MAFSVKRTALSLAVWAKLFGEHNAKTPERSVKHNPYFLIKKSAIVEGQGLAVNQRNDANLPKITIQGLKYAMQRNASGLFRQI